MFEELLISVLFIIVLIILCIISNLYSNKEGKKEKYIMLRNSIKEEIKLYEDEKETEPIKNNDTDWMNIFKKKEKINELNRLLIDEDIVVSEDGNIKVIFKYEDKCFEALDFINRQKCDIIASS